MNLQTHRLKIIPCTEATLKEFKVEKSYQTGPHIDQYLDDLKENPDLLGWGVWLVVTKKNHMIIGDIGFKGKPDLTNTVEVGYGIASTAQNKGYATESVNAVIDWAFSFENVATVTAECQRDNLSSIKVLEKIGMKQIGLDNEMMKWKLNKSYF